MLREVLDYIHYYFVPLKGDLVTYTIAGGVISPSFGAVEGDLFYVCGSSRNDGVYTWHENGIKDDDDSAAAGLRDETFAGTIRLMAVPPDVIRLSGEIKQWVDTNSATLTSPLQSESFNGYSYTLRSGRVSDTGENGQLSWRDIYGKRLERWRRPYV